MNKLTNIKSFYATNILKKVQVIHDQTKCLATDLANNSFLS